LHVWVEYPKTNNVAIDDSQAGNHYYWNLCQDKSSGDKCWAFLDVPDSAWILSVFGNNTDGRSVGGARGAVYLLKNYSTDSNITSYDRWQTPPERCWGAQFACITDENEQRRVDGGPCGELLLHFEPTLCNNGDSDLDSSGLCVGDFDNSTIGTTTSMTSSECDSAPDQSGWSLWTNMSSECNATCAHLDEPECGESSALTIDEVYCEMNATLVKAGCDLNPSSLYTYPRCPCNYRPITNCMLYSAWSQAGGCCSGGSSAQHCLPSCMSLCEYIATSNVGISGDTSGGRSSGDDDDDEKCSYYKDYSDFGYPSCSSVYGGTCDEGCRSAACYMDAMTCCSCEGDGECSQQYEPRSGVTDKCSERVPGTRSFQFQLSVYIAATTQPQLLEDSDFRRRLGDFNNIIGGLIVHQQRYIDEEYKGNFENLYDYVPGGSRPGSGTEPHIADAVWGRGLYILICVSALPGGDVAQTRALLHVIAMAMRSRPSPQLDTQAGTWHI
ncbi:hypothetical protein CYMTET_26074, partial [Cymbomonas tetramitiformis]